MQRKVTWLNMTARYTPAELRLMRKLTRRELEFVHEAKARFDGRLR